MRLVVSVEVQVSDFVEVGPLNVKHVFIHNLRSWCRKACSSGCGAAVGGPLLGPCLFLVEFVNRIMRRLSGSLPPTSAIRRRSTPESRRS